MFILRSPKCQMANLITLNLFLFFWPLLLFIRIFWSEVKSNCYESNTTEKIYIIFFFYYSRKNKTMLCKNKERTYFWFRSQQTSMCACETSFFVIPEKLIPSPLINEPLYYFSLSIKMDTMIRVLHILLDVCCFVFFCLY